jgi:hypothetical protein
MNEFIKSEHIVTGGTATISLGSVEDWPITRLKKICQKNRVPGNKNMTKDQLVAEVKKILDKMGKSNE